MPRGQNYIVEHLPFLDILKIGIIFAHLKSFRNQP